MDLEHSPKTYRDYLIAVATQAPLPPQPIAAPDLVEPVSFFLALLHELAYHPITRLGLDKMLDALFAEPQFAPLLIAPTTSQARVATEVLPLVPAAFQPYWTHIIQPAWDQHADIVRTTLATSESGLTGLTDPRR